MSILLANDYGWIISHPKYFENLKVSEISCNNNGENIKNTVTLRLNPDLFEITEPFKDNINVKGKRVTNVAKDNLSETANLVKTISEKLLTDPSAKQLFTCTEKTDDDGQCSKPMNSWPKNNFLAVETSQNFFEAVKSSEFGVMRGENPFSVETIVSAVSSQNGTVDKYLFPPRTKFYCNDVMKLETVFMKNEETLMYDLIVMDPPWWNKFIRRKKRRQQEAGYLMMETDELTRLPIQRILKKEGVVVVWCTNARSHQAKLVNEIFPVWGVRHVQTLYWLKVTTSGVPVCPFNEEGKKQPFETIIIGAKGTTAQTPRGQDSTKLILSVPSSINSHKPPLTNVLERVFPDKDFEEKLEIFARYLTPGFTSYGNEVIKLQHKSLFVV